MCKLGSHYHKIKPHWVNQLMQSGPNRPKQQPVHHPPYYTATYRKHSSFGPKYRLGITSLHVTAIYKLLPTSKFNKPATVQTFVAKIHGFTVTDGCLGLCVCRIPESKGNSLSLQCSCQTKWGEYWYRWQILDISLLRTTEPDWQRWAVGQRCPVGGNTHFTWVGQKTTYLNYSPLICAAALVPLLPFSSMSVLLWYRCRTELRVFPKNEGSYRKSLSVDHQGLLKPLSFWTTAVHLQCSPLAVL